MSKNNVCSNCSCLYLSNFLFVYIFVSNIKSNNSCSSLSGGQDRTSRTTRGYTDPRLRTNSQYHAAAITMPIHIHISHVQPIIPKQIFFHIMKPNNSALSHSVLPYLSSPLTFLLARHNPVFPFSSRVQLIQIVF